ncbi:MAG: acyltransferase [Desulfobacterales bacterium]|nr:acyltransferase [Desulfobacterales bacterium]
MFGYLRFILAFLVVISHIGVRFNGLNPGVIAVVMFYILAGYVVSHLWRDIIPAGKGRLYRFYMDRALRIFPLYLYVALLTLVFLGVTGYARPDFSPLKLIHNVLIVPLNYYMVFDSSILRDPQWCLIPPAWSLGAELQAYLILPGIFLFNRLKILLVFLSLAVYLMACFSFIHPDYFGYRLVFGVFFMFAAGSAIQCTQQTHKNSTLFDRRYLWLLWGVIAVLGVIFQLDDRFTLAYARETCLGLFIGIPVIYTISRCRVRLPGNSLLGALSYGLFLSHFLVIWWLDYTQYAVRCSISYIPVLTMCSLAISYAGIRIIEKNIDLIRKK